MASEARQLGDLESLSKVDLLKLVDELRQQNQDLSSQLQALLNRTFRTGREKVDPDQLHMFGLGVQPPEPTPAPARKPAPASKPKKGHGRQSFGSHLPREVVEIDIPEAERRCPDCGEERVVISDEVSERGHVIPAQVIVKRYVRKKRACPNGHGVVAPPVPPALIEKTKYEPSVYAYIVVSKYTDHLPLHRLAGMLKRSGIHLPKSTMWGMVERVAELVSPILAEMRRQILEAQIIQSDETPVVARLEDQKGSRKAYIWVYLSGRRIVFDFTLTRERDGPIAFLGDWSGTLLIDGYIGFDEVVKQNEITRAGCLSHARRKVHDAWTAGDTDAAKLLLLMNRLFTIERSLRGRASTRDLSEGEFHDLRLEVRARRSKPILGRIESEMDRLWVKRSVDPKTLLGKALGYLERQWTRLTQFVIDGALEIHNNDAERALRSVAIGRKNWMVFGSPKGGRVASVLYSLVLSCKAMDVDPQLYLEDVFQRISTTPQSEIAALTPWAWADSRPSLPA